MHRDSFHALIDAMTAKGYTREELMDAGLVSRAKRDIFTTGSATVSCSRSSTCAVM